MSCSRLIYYPSAYFFAVLLGRQPAIIDDSDLGMMCKVIVCGFPFLSEFTSKYPNEAVQSQKHYIILERFLKNQVHERYPNIDSFMSKSNWILDLEESNQTASRIANYTSCPKGDVLCAEIFAFQKLIVGPLHPTHREDFIHRVQCGDPQLSEDIVSYKWTEAPRFDAAVHLRNQFPHFEQQVHADDAKYQQAVQLWLSSSECSLIFRMMLDKLIETFSKHDDRITRSRTNYSIFVATDNEMVKHAFTSYLSASSSLHFNVVSAASDGVMHIGTCKDCRSEQTVRSLAYDWYLMSLSKSFLLWRLGGTAATSTYSSTAATMAGGTYCGNGICLRQTRQVLALIGRSPAHYWVALS